MTKVVFTTAVPRVSMNPREHLYQRAETEKMMIKTYCHFLLVCVACICVSTDVLAEEPSWQLPDEAGVIDVTKPPYNADNTGRTIVPMRSRKPSVMPGRQVRRLRRKMNEP
jgi:hypothetical protein